MFLGQTVPGCALLDLVPYFPISAREESKSNLLFSLGLWVFFLVFLGLHPLYMEVPRPGVQSELQLPACTTAHGNAGSLIHWGRPGIKPSSS